MKSQTPHTLVLIALLAFKVVASAQSSTQSESRLADLRKTADQGDAGAQFDLGVWYYNAVPQNYAEAAKWFRKAADQDIGEAQLNLGIMYSEGTGVPQDYAEAIKWYRKAADQGEPSAQYNLGLMYGSGRGLPQDYAEAMKWFRKAADQGYAVAEGKVGASYAIGNGVPQDYAEAVKWFRKAADQGEPIAQFNLGVNYFNGQGVPQDYVPAHMWSNLAAAALNGDRQKDASKLRDSIASKMTPQQIAEAQRLAREWKPSSESAHAADFEQKLKCATYNSQVEARLTMAPNAPMSKVLDSLFYSPVQNSCVVAYYTIWKDIEDMKAFGSTYVLEDVLTRESILSVSTTTSKTAKEEFQAKKAALKVPVN